MPELPDVEVFRQYFDATSLHQTINETDVQAPEILSDVTVQKLKNESKGKQFDKTCRHGKYMFARLDTGGWLVFHFGMTGHFIYFKGGEEQPKHSRVLFRFENENTLAYISQRKLGRIFFSEKPEDFINRHELGPDAIQDVPDAEALGKLLKDSSAIIKSALMDQGLIAGIGNEYSDEILFQAGIHPKAKANSLEKGRIVKLFKAMKNVLETAVEKNADPARFPDTFLMPQRYKGGKCPGCAGELKIEKIGGRTAYYCPECQSR